MDRWIIACAACFAAGAYVARQSPPQPATHSPSVARSEGSNSDDVLARNYLAAMHRRGADSVVNQVKTEVHDALLRAGVESPHEVFSPALEHTVELILPGTVCPTPASECPECIGGGGNGACAKLGRDEAAAIRTSALNVLAKAFGGARCSGQADVGGWIDGVHELVVEDAIVCTSSSAYRALKPGLETVFSFARQLGRELGQDKMAVAVDGGLLLLPPAAAVGNGGQATKVVDRTADDDIIPAAVE